MIKFKFNQSQLERIQGKITRMKQNSENDGKFFFTIEYYSKAYRDSVIRVMGEVDAGTPDNPAVGKPTITFLGESDSTTWEPLSKRSIRRKIKKNGLITFWYETGEAWNETQRSVAIGSYKSKGVMSVFAGLDSGLSPEAYRHALATEFGGKGSDKSYAKRALFTIANELFKRKREAIMKAVRDVLMEGVNWGGTR